jgi:apolipoprotein D and lipocalin family protein
MMNKKDIKKGAALAGGIALGLAALMAYRRFKKQNALKLKDVPAVKPFLLEKYLGKWYEIARLDFRQEHNMTNVTAEYSLNEDGMLKVVNRGFDTAKGSFKEAEGKAMFVGEPDEARLKVSFFGPFYSAYTVVSVDHHYRYALVAGQNLNYLWLLSRKKRMPDDMKQQYLEKAAALGYNIDNLLWTEHE